MHLVKKLQYAALAGLILLALPASADALVINEIRIDQPSSDNDEYFELFGDPGASLDGFTYLVIGDGVTSCGTIEAVVDLSGQVIPGDGYFLAGEGTMTIATPDAVLDLNFENSDNVTHLLVSGFTGASGDDLDVDDDGVLDAEPWGQVVDSVGLYEGTAFDCAAGNEYLYSDTTVGPDGSFVPGHVFRCPDGGTWLVGAFDPADGTDTPGTSNVASCPVQNESSSWGALKSKF